MTIIKYTEFSEENQYDPLNCADSFEIPIFYKMKIENRRSAENLDHFKLEI